MDQNQNLLKKACSRSNYEKQLGAINSGGHGEGASKRHIIRKKSKTFLTVLYTLACIKSVVQKMRTSAFCRKKLVKKCLFYTNKIF